MHLSLIGNLGLFPLNGKQARAKLRRIRGVHIRVERPVFFRLKIGDFLIPFANNAQRHGLHATGTQIALHLFPQERADFVADQAVEETASLLSRHLVFIDPSRLLQGLGHPFLRDFVQHHPVDLILVRIL